VRRFASVASLERTSRRRSRLALAAGVALGLALPPLLGGAADLLPEPTVPALEASAPRSFRWQPAPPEIQLPDMIRENPGERRRLDLSGMTRR
jgi:hypothetical protein